MVSDPTDLCNRFGGHLTSLYQDFSGGAPLITLLSADCDNLNVVSSPGSSPILVTNVFPAKKGLKVVDIDEIPLLASKVRSKLFSVLVGKFPNVL